ncbi:hypothetical protein MRX96_016443 [Rhipicephalus microplus]
MEGSASHTCTAIFSRKGQGRGTLEAYASVLRQSTGALMFDYQSSYSKHLRRMHQMASITIPALPLTNTCSSLDPEIWALMNQRLALMNRKDLYVIVVTLLYSQPSCSKHLRRMYQLAPTTLPTQPLRPTCSALDPELWALMNQEDLYVILIAVVVASTGSLWPYLLLHQ